MCLFDQIAEAGGLLDAGAGFGADVEDEGAVVAAGEEVLAEEGHQQEGSRDRTAGRAG